MKLEVLRFSSEPDSTNGLLFETTGGFRKFISYTLEDEFRKVKVKHETRIPQGSYKIVLKKTGGFHSRFKKKYGAWHRGMLHITDVPGFRAILIHPGNDSLATSGCLLIGLGQTSNQLKPKGWVSSSVAAYKSFYPKVADAIEKGEDVEITYIDYDGVIPQKKFSVRKRYRL